MKKTIINISGFRNILIFTFLGVILLIAGCYTIAYVIQPGVVEPDTAFNVTLQVQPSEGDWGDHFSSYGVLGILLPEGWTVQDSIQYVLDFQEEFDTVSGYLCYNDTVASFLDSSLSQSPNGYYWWGAKSIDVINLFAFKEGFIQITLMTDSVVGDFNLRYFLGDYSDNYKKNPDDPFGIKDSTEFLSIKVDRLNAIKTWQNEDWKVFPNPSDGVVFIEQQGVDADVTMRIFDLNGKLQKSAVLLKSLSRVDLGDCPKGTYIVSLEKKGEIKTQKIIIQ